MERIMRWRAEPTRSSRVHRRNRGGRGLRIAAAAGAMVAVTMPVLSADGAVSAGRAIEVSTGTDMVVLSGYPKNTNVTVEVVRHGIVVAHATRMTDSLGGITLNHVGGAAGDCFELVSPDIQPSDTIQTTVLKPGGGVDTSLVRGVWLNPLKFTSDTTIEVSGHVAVGDQPGAVDPAADAFELRIRKDVPWISIGRKDRREPISASEFQPDGTFTHVVTANVQDIIDLQQDSETLLQWTDATGTERTVAQAEPPEPLLGCPNPATGPTAPVLRATDDTGKEGDYITSKATDLTFFGLAGTGVTGAPGPGQNVTLQVDGRPRARVTADADGVYQFTGVNLKPRATPHTIRVKSPEGFAARLVTVDVKAPGVRLRTADLAPLHLAGREKLRASYSISEGATIEATINHLDPTFAVKVFEPRTRALATTSEFVWDGKNVAGRDVRTGRYQLVLTVTDKAGNSTLHRDTFRVVK